MGLIRLYTCKCGYEEQLHIGFGMRAEDYYTVKKCVPEAVFSAFDEEYNKGNVLEFALENEVVRCAECKRILTVNTLTYRLKADDIEDNEELTSENEESALENEESSPKEVRYIGECPCCKGAVCEEEDIERITCPKCGGRMYYRITGHWD